MSGVITVRRNDDAEQVELTTTTTGLDLFGDDRSVVAMRVKGESRDLQREVSDGDTVEPILIDEPEGLSIVRHLAEYHRGSVQVESQVGLGSVFTVRVPRLQ